MNICPFIHAIATSHTKNDSIPEKTIKNKDKTFFKAGAKGSLKARNIASLMAVHKLESATKIQKERRIR